MKTSAVQMTDDLAARLRERVEGIEARADSLERSVNGDPHLGLDSLRKELNEAKTDIRSLKQERAEMASRMKGIAIGLGLTGVTGAGTLVTVLSGVYGG